MNVIYVKCSSPKGVRNICYTYHYKSYLDFPEARQRAAKKADLYVRCGWKAKITPS